MVKVRYTYNNKIVEKDVYEASLILCYMRSKIVNLSVKPTCHFKNQFQGSTSTSIVNDEQTLTSVVYNEQTSTYIVSDQHASTSKVNDEHAPIVNEPLPNNNNEPLPNNNNNEPLPNNNNNNENVAAVAGGARGRIPPIPMIQNVIGACSPPFEKKLTKTDVTDNQGRLALHKEFVNSYLAPMFNNDENLSNGIDVIVYDSEGRQYDMSFRLWTSKLYVLTAGWKKFYKANDLTEAGEYVTVWMFRHVDNHKLCFAIIRGRAEGH